MTVGVQVPAIAKQIAKIISHYGIDENDNSVVSILEITAQDGKNYNVKHYSLDIILGVGHRIQSKEALHFSRWANNVIRDYLTKGVAINESRLDSLSDEVLAKVSESSIKAVVKAYPHQSV